MQCRESRTTIDLIGIGRRSSILSNKPPTTKTSEEVERGKSNYSDNAADTINTIFQGAQLYYYILCLASRLKARGSSSSSLQLAVSSSEQIVVGLSLFVVVVPVWPKINNKTCSLRLWSMRSTAYLMKLHFNAGPMKRTIIMRINDETCSSSTNTAHQL